MDFYSTKNSTNKVDLKEAVIRSLPPDNGLYMPGHVPLLTENFWNNWRDYTFAELATAIVTPILGEDIAAEDLKSIVEDSINFDAPVVSLDDKLHVLELFQGPTLAFKDFGARFMARLMGFLTKDDNQQLTVLVATSGDTGGAVASAFHKVEGTRVIILYPSGKVSALQEKQLTTLGDNIHALEINGTFDDCQRMVKSAFLDTALSLKFNLTSANSINISRLLPQTFYYFNAARQFEDGAPLSFVIPSGNFGNLTAGLFAQRMGLNVKQFVAATNANDVVPRYLNSGQYEPRPSVATISNAMDVGAPSNFARMEALHKNSWQDLKKNISGFTYNDESTLAMITEVYRDYEYQICPHTAVAVLAAKEWNKANPEDEAIVLATAHPAKFLDTMEAALGEGSVHIPDRLACLTDIPKVSTKMEPIDQSLKDWIINNLKA